MPLDIFLAHVLHPDKNKRKWEKFELKGSRSLVN